MKPLLRLTPAKVAPVLRGRARFAQVTARIGRGARLAILPLGCITLNWASISYSQDANVAIVTLADIATPNIFAWTILPPAQAWKNIVASEELDRPKAYWQAAIALLHAEQGHEATGMLDLLIRQRPDAVTNPNYTLARGQALLLMRRDADALVALSDPALLRSSQGCLWRIRAAAAIPESPDRTSEYNCALPAIDRLSAKSQLPFLIAMARHAYNIGRYPLGLAWIGKVKTVDPEAKILEAKLLFASGRSNEAEKALKAAQASGDEQARAEASFIKLQRAALNKSQRPADIIKGLDNLRYGWRDHQVELDALAFGFRVARSSNDRKNSLALGATLLRNFPEASRSREILPEYRKILLAVLNPSNGLTMDQSIGIYWEYRDLGPDGAEGDAITLQIARRLEVAGLYERAAQLLQYQLENRAQDIAKGPISIKAAMLSIRAGQYDRALQMITDSEGPRYPVDITHTRKKVAAVALTLLGRRPEALAALDEVPDGLAITAEILWQDQQWADLEAAQALLLRRTGAMSPVARTLIFRQALALSMQSKTAQIEDLRRRYRGAFAGQPDGAAFDLLTAPVDGIDPAAIAEAIKKLPSVSPAGAFGDLLSLAPPPKARPAKSGRAPPRA
jgi:predicted negative regulator of RcsB-dependent stress response